ncbi:hypothetical protein BCR33DRAFT_713335 [Rhizoclosmatium globosum]|uniref:Uncharacterized protein n=1 Tax=Rhizoclosmatium globosum TaxID=329046 RepID=A0A1Y2CUJ6_9FUNG|nr:hypothetical protein BCR33DRAFT_713335 [Rhizoclosmatium globosum]|eukprot:ORY50566.1 hypothetical protein BCR33DRAFT_713335 [Rhizoclosmatium globosum]
MEKWKSQVEELKRTQNQRGFRELTRLNRKQFKLVQLSKLLRPEGFHGVRLEGFGFTPKQFGSQHTTVSD